MTIAGADSGGGLRRDREAAPRRADWFRQRPPRAEWPWLIVGGLTVAVVLAPIAGLIWFAVRGSGDLWPHLAANVLPPALRTTVVLLIGVAAVTSVIGVGAAWLVATCRFPGRRFFEAALLLPLAVPTYIVAFAYLDVTHPVGPVQTFLRGLFGIHDPRGLWFPEIRSMGGAIFLLGLVLYPYVYLPVRALFMMQSVNLLEAARTLGANRAVAFFRVALPLARPAFAVGLSLALLETLNDIGASEFLGVRTLTVAIYTTWVTRGSIEGAAQIALFMLVIVAAILAIERRARRRQRYAPRPQSRPPTPTQLTGWQAAGAFAACALPIVFGFVVPALYLAGAAWTRVSQHGLPPALGSWIGSTLGFALGATIVVTVLGLALAYTIRLARHPAARALVRMAGIGYAIPGTVLAVGLLVPLGALDNAIADAWKATFGFSPGLIFIGSGAALVIAYTIRFLTSAIGGGESGLAKISPSLDMVSRTLGAGPAKTALEVHLPLLLPAIGAAAILVFVDCMKELPATLLLRPFNFETLATQIYGEAARGTYEDGAISALVIVLAGLIPVLLLSRMGRGQAWRQVAGGSGSGR